MSRLIHIGLLAAILASCTIGSLPPRRLSQLTERAITALGQYALPQWSPDGRYIAFISDTNRLRNLTVYDTETTMIWPVASEVDQGHYSWTPENRLSYLKFRPELSGTPCPAISDLHTVDVNGQNDHVAVSNLYGPDSYIWFKDRHELVALLQTSSARCDYHDIYSIDVSTGRIQQLISRQELGIKYPVALALSPNESLLAIYGFRESAFASGGSEDSEMVLFIFSLGSKSVIREIVPNRDSTLLRVEADSLQANLSGEHLAWAQGEEWIFDKANAPSGECYNYSLFFLNVINVSKSFCIPTAEGIITEPALSIDLKHVTFILSQGPNEEYIMIADFTDEYRSRLEK